MANIYLQMLKNKHFVDFLMFFCPIITKKEAALLLDSLISLLKRV